MLRSCFHLETPFVGDLSVQVEIHFYHQQSVAGPGEPRGAAAVGRRHVTGAVEVSEVVMSCGSRESGSKRVQLRSGQLKKQTSYLFFRHRM